MTRYISKSAIVKEIEKRIKEIEEIGTYLSPKGILTNLLCYINNIKEKEVDLEKEFDKCCENHIFDDECEVYTARRFFELGMQVSNKIQKGE